MKRPAADKRNFPTLYTKRKRGEDSPRTADKESLNDCVFLP